MGELIPIIKNSSNSNAVDGRILHEAIESKTADFSTWIQRRIKKFGFTENQDYEVFFHNSVEKGRPLKEYILSLDMAKEVAMLENNQKGREIRQYFIKAEKSLSQIAEASHIQKALAIETQISAVRMALDFLNASDSSKLRAMQILFKNNGLDTKLLPSYTESKGKLLSATELLKSFSVGISAVAFNKLLIAEGILEERTRPSRSKGEKSYKALTEKGLIFGENMVSPQNDKEVQPMYYEHKFEELCRIVMN